MIPQNSDSERAVLGSILIDPDCIRILDLVPADFFAEHHQLIYQAILKCQDPNQITVAHELVKMGKLDEIGGVSYLSDLVASTPTSVGVESYAKVVKDCSVNRRIISASEQIKSLAEKNVNPKENLDKVNNIFTEISKTLTRNDIITPHNLATQGMNYYSKLEKGMGQSVLTGINRLDEETGGAFPGELWIFGGRPSIGKTTCLLQMAESMCKKGNVLFASLEMNWSSILDRMMASHLGIHPRSLRIGSYSDEFYHVIINTLPKIAEQNIYFFGKGVRESHTGINSEILYRVANNMKMNYGLSAILVDYLGLLAEDGKNPYEKTTNASVRLKRIAESLEVPVICAAQLSRALERETDKRPNLSSLRESGHVEEDADVVLFLYREDYYRENREQHPECLSKAEIIMAKQRQGESNLSFPLNWDSTRRLYV